MLGFFLFIGIVVLVLVVYIINDITNDNEIEAIVAIEREKVVDAKKILKEKTNNIILRCSLSCKNYSFPIDCGYSGLNFNFKKIYLDENEVLIKQRMVNLETNIEFDFYYFYNNKTIIDIDKKILILNYLNNEKEINIDDIIDVEITTNLAMNFVSVDIKINDIINPIYTFNSDVSALNDIKEFKSTIDLIRNKKEVEK